MADLCERQRTKLPAPRPPTMGGPTAGHPLAEQLPCAAHRISHAAHEQVARKPLFFRQGLGRRRHAFFAAASLAKPELAAEGAALRPPPFGISAAD